MFGSEEILAFIRRQVGIRTDTDDPAGSLHSKIGNLKEVMQNYVYGRIKVERCGS